MASPAKTTRTDVQGVTARPERRWTAGALRTLIVGLTALAVSVPASPALARQSPTDRIGSRPLAESTIPASQAPDIDARAGILVADDGRVLWSRGGSTARPMASTTKIMTSLLVLEKGGLDRKVRVSAAASRVPYGLGLRAGERISVRRLLQLTLVASSNDAAYALGEYVSGSMPRFVARMNERAAELGLEETRFANAHGLDAPGHHSSPADLAKLSRQAMKEPYFRKVVSMQRVKLPRAASRPARAIKSTSSLLLGKYDGLKGGKTGYTGDAGYCYVSTATRNGVTLTAVVLGADSHASRFRQTKRLFNWGFKNLKVQKLAEENQPIGNVLVGSDKQKVAARVVEAATARVFRPDGKVRRETSLVEDLRLPVLAGQPLGEARFVQGERVIATAPIEAAEAALPAQPALRAVPVSDYLDVAVPVKLSTRKVDLPAYREGAPVERIVEVEPAVAAPVKKGESLGEVVYRQGDTVVARIPVVASESIERPTFLQNLGMAFERGWREVVGGSQAAQAQTGRS